MSEEQEAKVGVSDVLEAISDTVLALVLFQVEAKENESSLVRLDVSPLLSSIKFLVDLAKVPLSALFLPSSVSSLLPASAKRLAGMPPRRSRTRA